MLCSPGHVKALILRIFSPKINSKFAVLSYPSHCGAHNLRRYGTILSNLSLLHALQVDNLFANFRFCERWKVMNAVRYWAVFFLGVAAGAAVALIYAPQTGEKTRKQLKRNLDDASDYLKETGEDLSKHAARVYKKTKGVAGDVASRVSSAAGNVSSAAGNIADKVGDRV
jgi:gas vesicle protein